jgi:hypothetical protein
MIRFASAAAAVVALCAASSAAQTPPTRLNCADGEAVALRRAPPGVARVSRSRLTVKWFNGTRTFRDSGLVDGSMDGISYYYCGYSARAGFHLIHKHDDAIFTGVLLNQTTGKLLPAGQAVIFAPDMQRYFATVQPDGLDGEEWYLYSVSGTTIWKGLSGITAKHPSLKYDYFIATLDAPQWAASGELQATLKCTSGKHATTSVTLRRQRGEYVWTPAVSCPPAR